MIGRNKLLNTQFGDFLKTMFLMATVVRETYLLRCRYKFAHLDRDFAVRECRIDRIGDKNGLVVIQYFS